MCDLICGKDALIAILSGEKIQYVPSSRSDGNWSDVGSAEFFDIDEWISEKSNASPVTFKFRLKPKTIMLNGVEVPSPEKERFRKFQTGYTLDSSVKKGYVETRYKTQIPSNNVIWWKNEEGVKQVVEALRNVFGGNNN